MKPLFLLPNHSNSEYMCSICGKICCGLGNNARPVNSGRCCEACIDKLVIPMRNYITRKYNIVSYNEYLITIKKDQEQL